MTEEVEQDAPVEEVDETKPIEADADTEEVKETEDNEDKAKDKEDPEPEKSSTSKKEDGVQKRIDELTKIRRETERDRDYWKNLAQTTQPATDPVEPGKTLADFEYDEGKYATYVTDLAKADAKTEVDKQLWNDKQARSKADFSSKESEFSKDIDDYHTVTRNNDLRITGEMVEAMQGSNEGPAVLYYLGKNPDVADRLSRLSPLDMAMALGEIKATKLAKEKPSPTKAPTPAPKLSATTQSTGIKASSTQSDSLTTEDWLKRRNKQVRG